MNNKAKYLLLMLLVFRWNVIDESKQNISLNIMNHLIYPFSKYMCVLEK